MTKIYGILDANNCLIDVSNSEKGCKQYATRNEYNKIGYRIGYNAFLTHIKIGKRWEKVNTIQKRYKLRNFPQKRFGKKKINN